MHRGHAACTAIVAPLQRLPSGDLNRPTFVGGGEPQTRAAMRGTTNVGRDHFESISSGSLSLD
jgi:hypothetical protein